MTAVCEHLHITRKTVARGLRELNDDAALDRPGVRLPGGGRPRILERTPELHAVLQDVLREHTAGSPMDATVKWTNLNRPQIAGALAARGHPVSVTVVDQLLRENGYRKRCAARRLTARECEHRDEQFVRIKARLQEFTDANNPVISMDTKKKEYIGRLYRDGRIYTLEPVQVFDHDFDHFADSVVIPHGIYDLSANTASLHLGSSHDTGEFACDSLRLWWSAQGRQQYPEASAILLLCDSGGSNDCRSYLFKQDLAKLVDEIGVPIRVAHYPPYTSKYNPIEHRVFCHITRSWRGVIFDSLETVKELANKTTTAKGLKVCCRIMQGTYRTGRKYAKAFRERIAEHVQFDDDLPKWNYLVDPNRQNPAR